MSIVRIVQNLTKVKSWFEDPAFLERIQSLDDDEEAMLYTKIVCPPKPLLPYLEVRDILHRHHMTIQAKPGFEKAPSYWFSINLGGIGMATTNKSFVHQDGVMFLLESIGELSQYAPKGVINTTVDELTEVPYITYSFPVPRWFFNKPDSFLKVLTAASREIKYLTRLQEEFTRNFQEGQALLIEQLAHPEEGDESVN